MRNFILAVACLTVAFVSPLSAQTASQETEMVDPQAGPKKLASEMIAAFKASDLDKLVSLYEQDAAFTTSLSEKGDFRGLEGVRAAWKGYIDGGAQIDFHEQVIIVVDNIALIQNRWTVPGSDASGVTAEVARRQDDGSWKYIIDSPYGAALIKVEGQ